MLKLRTITAVEEQLGKRRVPATIECLHNPTDITDTIFKLPPVWKDPCHRWPAWNCYRYGISGNKYKNQTIYIGGEQDEHYDPNFFIYNDVIVVDDVTQAIRVYGYPRDVFPPTDFHETFVIGDMIWMIGSLGYQMDRQSTIQVFRLHVPTMRMERVPVTGDLPPWMYFHEGMPTCCLMDDDGFTIRLLTRTRGWTFDTRTCVFIQDMIITRKHPPQ